MLLTLARTYLRPYAGAIAVVVAFQAVQALANLYLPGLNADIIDNGIVTGDTGYILRIGAVMIAVTALQVVAAIVAVYYGARTAMAFGRDLRKATFDRVQTFAAEEVGRFGAPTLITRTTNDVQQVQLVTFMFFAMLIAAPIMGIGGIIMAMRQDLGLSWLIAVAVPVLVAAVAFIISRMRPHFRKMQTRIDAINRVLREQIMGIQVIRAFVKTDYERRRFEVANDDYRQVAVRAGQWMSLMFPTVMLVMNVSSVAVIWFGGHRVADGTLEVGTLSAYLTYLVQILMAVMMATFLFVLLPRAEVSAERIHEVLATDPSVTDAADAVDVPVTTGTVDLRDVTFSYPDAEEPVLRGVDLVARPGETTAIIGSTGSGKSTLLNLVPRLFDVTGGQVLLDGVDVRERTLTTVWSSMGLVPQKAFLFGGTVASNLRMGDPDASDEALWEALEIAQARDFVEAMPQGLDASVSQGGANLSGGQRQRLAIARAIVARPRILLFDDSFSALDFATDAALRRALRAATADAAVIVVAQRVSTIRDADRIVVLDEGRAVGTGRHHELMESCETYREIVLSQLSEEEAA
ncbi:ATP-binding cassette subfamily B protein [Mumia flava]|uniref:ATP-binding cassette subfamily B protein n=1 Tax=Mumia flava TaxID=1348852 RepID=A0A0B2BLM8_9ACTN|nr:ABC transporter ATP-binding protein [Mumia flava]PJJ56330.1 ATP-binding cassette subfamily B protein [Mumia flava]